MAAAEQVTMQADALRAGGWAGDNLGIEAFAVVLNCSRCYCCYCCYCCCHCTCLFSLLLLWSLLLLFIYFVTLCSFLVSRLFSQWLSSACVLFLLASLLWLMLFVVSVNVDRSLLTCWLFLLLLLLLLSSVLPLIVVFVVILVVMNCCYCCNCNYRCHWLVIVDIIVDIDCYRCC